jgi:predicted HTH transcriptional regulator
MAQMQSTAVAFSNADGGVILIGVRDDGAIAARALDAGTQDDIHRAMQAARDVGRYGLSELDVDGKPVTVLSVATSRGLRADIGRGRSCAPRHSRRSPVRCRTRALRQRADELAIRDHRGRRRAR